MVGLGALGPSGCASSGAAQIETIHTVPPFVLTVDDLVARVRRSSRDLAVSTEGLYVVGVLVKRGQPCDLITPQPVVAPGGSGTARPTGPYGAPPYGAAPTPTPTPYAPAPAPYGATQTQAPYAPPPAPYGQAPYGQGSPYGQAPYGQSPYGPQVAPYGAPPAQYVPAPAAPYQQPNATPYGQAPYANYVPPAGPAVNGGAGLHPGNGRPQTVYIPPSDCSKGDAAHVFATSREGGQKIHVVLNETAPLEVGATYVLSGTAEMAPNVPGRWLFRGQLLARVER
ncbi:MAG: hypothetical protein HOW73_33300 [Polyangiaceae bacterium]|nr:hypothetical protein [Polyangiaceae bacterium]